MNLQLTDKTAVVCGSTQGIGKASAIELAKLGASVVLVARNEDKLKAALLDLETSANQKHSYIVADFTKPVELEDIISKWAAKNRVHILVNNTGGPKGGPIRNAATSEFIDAFNQHLICNQFLFFYKKHVVNLFDTGLHGGGAGKCKNLKNLHKN